MAARVASGRRRVLWFVAALLLAAPAASAQAAGTWLSVDSMSTPRSGHEAVQLADGRVLAVGGVTGPGGPTGSLNTTSAELFDPATRSWSPTASMHVPRHNFTATRLQDGKVLVAGGSDATNTTKTTELYDPATGSWLSAGDMHYAREAFTATLLPDGRVLAVGGSASGSSAELYDPATRSWTLAAPPLFGHSQHIAELLKDGSVLVVGDFGNGSEPAERYLPSTNQWTQTTPMTTGGLGKRSGAVSAALSDGSVLVAGGLAGGGSITRTAEVYDSGTATWTRVGDAVAARWHGAATRLANGDVLVEGGVTNNGNGSTTALASAEVFDHTARTWSAAPSMFDLRSGHTSTLLPDGSVLVTGGYDNRGTYMRTAEIYVPNDTRRQTSTSVSCSPDKLVPNQPTTCTATVTDTASGTKTTPTGTVRFTTILKTCTLAASGPGTARCSVSHTPASNQSRTGRTDTILATYSGDVQHARSSGSTTINVFDGPCTRDYGPDASNVYRQAVSKSNPRNYYRLGEQSGGGAIADGTHAGDESGANLGAYHGNVRGGAEGAQRCGPDNFAVTFDGDGSAPGRVTLGNLTSVGDFTIEGWSYLTEGTNGGPLNPNGNATLFGDYGSERLLIRPNAVYGDIIIGDVKYIVQVSTPSNTLDWHYWAFVRSGGTLTLYRDGARVGSLAGVPTSTIPLRGNIGEQANGAYPFQGALDEIALYTRGLPASEVSSHYSEATPRSVNPNGAG